MTFSANCLPWIDVVSTLCARWKYLFAACLWLKGNRYTFTWGNSIKLFITKTCLYNFDPLKPHFYTVKLGFTGVYIIFLFLLKNIDCGYSLEPPRRGGSNQYPQSMLWAEIWKLSDFFLKIFIFWWWNFQYIWIGVFSLLKSGLLQKESICSPYVWDYDIYQYRRACDLYTTDCV